MSVQAETRSDLTIDNVLRAASAEQLRRALKTRTVAAAKQVWSDAEQEFIPAGEGIIDDEYALDEALVRWRRGDKREALRQLENALGRDWHGLGDLRPEDLR